MFQSLFRYLTFITSHPVTFLSLMLMLQNIICVSSILISQGKDPFFVGMTTNNVYCLGKSNKL